MSLEVLQTAVDSLLQSALPGIADVGLDLQLIKNQTLPVLSRAAAQKKDEEDNTWKRPRGLGVQSSSTKQGNEANAKKKAIVTCPQQHKAIRFQTSHSGYTCDVCRKHQAQNTTMYGCRMCNWDACVPCHGRLHKKLQDELDALHENATAAAAAAPRPEDAPVQLPAQTLTAVSHGLDLFRKDAEACRMLFEIARVVTLDEVGKKQSIRNSLAVAVNEHMDKPECVQYGMAALHNATAGSENISEEEATALIQLARTCMDKHYENADVIEKLLGFCIVLHDASSTARKLFLNSNLVPSLCQLASDTDNSEILLERTCGLLARLASSSDREQVLPLMFSLVATHPGSDRVCEQVILSSIAVSGGNGGSSSDEMISIMEKLSKARFA